MSKEPKENQKEKCFDTKYPNTERVIGYSKDVLEGQAQKCKFRKYWQVEVNARIKQKKQEEIGYE